jgi:iron only hydrogenase large subunit-like protein
LNSIIQLENICQNVKENKTMINASKIMGTQIEGTQKSKQINKKQTKKKQQLVIRNTVHVPRLMLAHLVQEFREF